MIDVQDVAKSFGSVQALNQVSFHVIPGRMIGLLWPNEAGKTTLMKILTGLLQPASGMVAIDRLDVFAYPREAQRHIGCLPENAPAYADLSVQAHLQ